MPHVPYQTLDRLGTSRVGDLIEFGAHDHYRLDGDDLNKLACLAARLADPAPLDACERTGFAEIIADALHEPRRRGVQ